MGARSGNNYLSALRRLQAELWLGQTRISDPTIHPAFVRRARAIATLYDLQMEHPGAMTVRLDDGDRVGISFIQPCSAAEVQARGAMFRRWAETTGGLLRDTPDAANAVLAAIAAAAPAIASGDARFAANLENYYRRARHHDRCIGLAEPLLDRAEEAGGGEPAAPELRLTIVTTDQGGLIISGAQRVSALAALAEELLILRDGDADDRSFAITCSTPGLKLECRDAAAGAFAEFECVARFDQARVPWERVFSLRGDTRHQTWSEEAGAALNSEHQRVVRRLLALEFRLGRLANSVRHGSAAAFPVVRTELHQLALAIQLARALLHAAECGAQPNRHGQWLPLAEPLATAGRLLRQIESASSPR